MAAFQIVAPATVIGGCALPQRSADRVSGWARGAAGGLPVGQAGHGCRGSTGTWYSPAPADHGYEEKFLGRIGSIDPQIEQCSGRELRRAVKLQTAQRDINRSPAHQVPGAKLSGWAHHDLGEKLLFVLVPRMCALFRLIRQIRRASKLGDDLHVQNDRRRCLPAAPTASRFRALLVILRV